MHISFHLDVRFWNSLRICNYRNRTIHRCPKLLELLISPYFFIFELVLNFSVFVFGRVNHVLFKGSLAFSDVAQLVI